MPFEEMNNLIVEMLPVIGKAISSFQIFDKVVREDVEGFVRLRVVEAMRRYDPSRNLRPSTFVYTVAKFAICEYLRKERRHKHSDRPCERSYIIDRSLDVPELHDALSRLSDRERSLIVDTYANGQTYTEVAAKWGVSRQRVEQVHKMSISKLREYLDVGLDT